MKRLGTKQRSLEGILATLRASLPEVRERFGVKSLGVFGSRVTGGARKSSDVDILVEYDEVPGFIGFGSLQIYLSELLGIKVDLVMADALKPNIGRRIHKEVVSV